MMDSILNEGKEDNRGNRSRSGHQEREDPEVEPGHLPGAPSAPIVLHCQAMRDLWREAQLSASARLPVLILGETGTGKEVLAQAIHQMSNRSEEKLISLNCGAIPAQLVESTLFGHEKGAFTGALQKQCGVFESASGGTIFLDEIGELPLAAQAALLRVLETQRLNRVGSFHEREVDVRILAATNQDLEILCAANRFRRDLLFRLNAMILKIPPLRERPEDIEPLSRLFLGQTREIEPEALRVLQRYPWPGNVRELKNAMERALVIAPGSRITLQDLPEAVRQQPPPPSTPVPDFPGEPSASPKSFPRSNLKSKLNEAERECIVSTLREAGLNRKRAAELMGISIRTLSYRLKGYGIRLRK